MSIKQCTIVNVQIQTERVWMVVIWKVIAMTYYECERHNDKKIV